MIEVTIQADKDGYQIFLPAKVTPKASKKLIRPFKAGQCHLEIWVTEAPEDGKANQSIIDLLSQTLSLPKRNILLAQGTTSRLKRFVIRTSEAEKVLNILAQAMQTMPEAAFIRK